MPCDNYNPVEKINFFFVYLEPLNDYCHSCGMIGLVDDDTTPLVSSSYINESCIYVCELCRSGAIVAHGGTTDSA